MDLQKALKLEPANRDAKRELARLTEIVRRKRLEEKKRFSGGLQRATSKGLYGDKEAEREKKKKLEAQASAKKRARHEKFNAARKEKGEDEVTFENWEKEEKEKAEKEEKAAEEARRRQQRQREEQRRKERGEDRVVVDDDLDLANCKGYKTLADGRRTSRVRRADLPLTSRGDAAAATRLSPRRRVRPRHGLVRGGESGRPRRGESAATSRRGRDAA